ncbi:alpha/beta hydrolase-fold protein [Mycobacteroides abscessus]|uniref:alpha/beta hydrolase-fold protein n=1 Tax=Mycobacteroides abscessus TaxID=36809 RepID=UPI0009A737BC|nr:alpha/beta hydrolase-fold protein [Mycobacteroides abscessus]SLG32944.1 Predicted hydrolase of the alpha/beta superfamily [Mycobacteroides abscessus subsp. massiliense]
MSAVSGHDISLLHGNFPVSMQVITGFALVIAIGLRTRRWFRRWVPVAVGIGVALAGWAYWYIQSEGWADRGNPAPLMLWVWIALTGVAATVLVVGWRTARWWRRAIALTAVPLTVLSGSLMLNQWVGYVRSVQSGWAQLTAGPLPNQADMATVTAAREERRGPTMTKGKLVPVDIPADASGFRHRKEIVYLPPAWFDSTRTELPTIMMIGGEFNTPSDWIRSGNAVEVADAFASQHGGNAPVMVFVDAGGSFNNDTECVNGPRGNSADHLTKDVVPFMISRFGVSPRPQNWGVVGWSMGGTCAVTLAAKHPELFSAFEDIAGDMSPNTGNKAQTIARLFGGDAGAWEQFDPATVMTRHGRYANTAGWFDVNGLHRAGSGAITSTGASPGTAANVPLSDQDRAAHKLCEVATAQGIACTVQHKPGEHKWPFAQTAFTSALPWMAGRIGTPTVPNMPLPR